MEISQAELDERIEAHEAWLEDDGGERLVIQDSNLRFSDLRDNDLRFSDLRDNDLRFSDLRDSDLRDSDLRGSDLRHADLWYANLRDSACTTVRVGFHRAIIMPHRVQVGCIDRPHDEIREVIQSGEFPDDWVADLDESEQIRQTWGDVLLAAIDAVEEQRERLDQYDDEEAKSHA